MKRLRWYPDISDFWKVTHDGRLSYYNFSNYPEYVLQYYETIARKRARAYGLPEPLMKRRGKKIYLLMNDFKNLKWHIEDSSSRDSNYIPNLLRNEYRRYTILARAIRQTETLMNGGRYESVDIVSLFERLTDHSAYSFILFYPYELYTRTVRNLLQRSWSNRTFEEITDALFTPVRDPHLEAPVVKLEVMEKFQARQKLVKRNYEMALNFLLDLAKKEEETLVRNLCGFARRTAEYEQRQDFLKHKTFTVFDELLLRFSLPKDFTVAQTASTLKKQNT